MNKIVRGFIGLGKTALRFIRLTVYTDSLNNITLKDEAVRSKCTENHGLFYYTLNHFGFENDFLMRLKANFMITLASILIYLQCFEKMC